MLCYKAVIEYDGTPFSGFQRQPHGNSIQSILEKAISVFARQQVMVQGAGRTDKGVHATAQVISFHMRDAIPPEKLRKSLNALMAPHPISVLYIENMGEDNLFHARFSACMRCYTYKIMNREGVLALEKNRAWHIRTPLNIKAMADASQILIGKHDFTSFRASHCQASNPIRTITRIDITQREEKIAIHVQAPSFLYHQVRNIVGSLVMVGRGLWTPAHIKTVLEAKDRTKAAPTAPACGLYFSGVDYGEYQPLEGL